MSYSSNRSFLLAIIINLTFGLNPQIKNEFPISNYINPEEYISADSLLKFENKGYSINDPVEKSKYYFIVSSLLHEKMIELNVKTDNVIEKISDLIKSYEEKLLKEKYIINHEVPDYEYKYIKFSDESVVNKVFYK